MKRKREEKPEHLSQTLPPAVRISPEYFKLFIINREIGNILQMLDDAHVSEYIILAGLEAACNRNDLKIVSLLLANQRLKNASIHEALFKACRFEQVEIVKLILSHMQLSLRNPILLFKIKQILVDALVIACRVKNIQIIELLIKMDVVDSGVELYNTLEIVAKEGEVQLLSDLLKFPKISSDHLGKVLEETCQVGGMGKKIEACVLLLLTDSRVNPSGIVFANACKFNMLEAVHFMLTIKIVDAGKISKYMFNSVIIDCLRKGYGKLIQLLLESPNMPRNVKDTIFEFKYKYIQAFSLRFFSNVAPLMVKEEESNNVSFFSLPTELKNKVIDSYIDINRSNNIYI